MKIGELITKSGVSYGILTSDDIDVKADARTFFTMYSAIMHDVKRYGYKDAYYLWTDSYDRLIAEAGFIGKSYCLRAGEAIRLYCSHKAGVEFAPRYVLSGDEGWVIDWLYLDEGSNGEVCFDTDFLTELRDDISSVEDCFATYKIALTQVDEAL